MTDKLPVVIAVVNNKGGVGKTTTSVNLGAALATPRRTVLLIDLDSQASASLWCGMRGRLHPSSANCLLDNYPVHKAIRTTATPNLYLLTGSTELANADVSLCDIPGRETALKDLLHVVRGRYDLIIIDCPPSLSLICVNALVAADVFIVPVTPQFLAAEGLVGLIQAVDKVRSRLGARGRLLGILLTMVDSRRAAGKAVCKRLRGEYRDRVFRTEIALSRTLEEAPAAGKTVLAFAPRSSAADAFRRLAGEVLDRLRSHARH